MRSLARALLVAAVGAGAGCTFLIDFDEVPGGGDASAAEASTGGDASDDRVTPDGSIAFPPPCDPAFPLADVKCNASFPRPNCASNTSVFPTYPAGKPRGGDLVTCNGGPTPTCVQHCPFGCATMPAGFPDMCDDCNGRPDGTYCVKDLRGPDGRNLGLAIDCTGGKTTKNYVCGEGRCATKCPRTDRAPSCCI
ncbi:MAG: hypothetical protein JST00_30435 [Deltaproteobacteria bacterium]|nr:hypothetical protein [Deltaproteobacteria bacterium]